MKKDKPPIYIQVKVIPKSGESKIVEKMADDTWKIRLKSTAEKGKANKELVSIVAKEIGVPSANIRIISGATARLKLLQVKFD